MNKGDIEKCRQMWEMMQKMNHKGKTEKQGQRGKHEMPQCI